MAVSRMPVAGAGFVALHIAPARVRVRRCRNCVRRAALAHQRRGFHQLDASLPVRIRIADFNRWATSISPWQALAAANLLLLICALFPRKMSSHDLSLATDGLLILQRLFKALPSTPERRRSYFLTRGLVFISANDNARAVEVLAKGVEEFPEDPLLGPVLGIAQIGTGDYPPARESLLRMLQGLKPEDAARASVLGNIAWVDVMIGTPEALNEAERFSAEAYALTPWVAAIQSTRGAALVERGEIEAALPLLRSALRGAEKPESRACVTCYLAIAAFREHRVAWGRALLRKAQRLDGQCGLLARAEEALRAADPPLSPVGVAGNASPS